MKYKEREDTSCWPREPARGREIRALCCLEEENQRKMKSLLKEDRLLY
jgi:hypothetical protein